MVVGQALVVMAVPKCRRVGAGETTKDGASRQAAGGGTADDGGARVASKLVGDWKLDVLVDSWGLGLMLLAKRQVEEEGVPVSAVVGGSTLVLSL